MSLQLVVSLFIFCRPALHPIFIVENTHRMSSNLEPLSLPTLNPRDDIEDITRDLLPETAQYTSFSQRNPSKDVIPLRSNGDRSVARTDEDITLRRQSKQDSQGALDAAIEKHLEQQRIAMEALAHDHNIPLAIIEQRCNHVSVYRKARKVNLANAITHAKSKEYNKGTSASYFITAFCS